VNREFDDKFKKKMLYKLIGVNNLIKGILFLIKLIISSNWYQQKICQYKYENKCNLRDREKEIEISPLNFSKLLTGKKKRLSEETRNKLGKWIER
jgi:DNA-binding Xre family transcriptional regulator